MAPSMMKVELGGATPSPAQLSPDITLLVGTRRSPHVYSLQTLRRAAYFRSLLDCRPPPPSAAPYLLPIDCEEHIFLHLMAVLRYGSIDALPPLSAADRFKLKRELEFFGIPFLESQFSASTSAAAASSSSSTSSSSSADDIPPPTSHFPLSDLPEFPTELIDPAKLVLVSRVDDDYRDRCPCSSDTSKRRAQWAINFHHRHAFCSACGRPAASALSPKPLAEMFMVVASYFAGEKLDSKKWFVGRDSTCALKFVSSKACCNCSCSTQSVWAASFYYSHAFCTQCGSCATGSSLICVLLALRYGGLHKSPKARRDSSMDAIVNRETPTLQPAPNRIPSYLSHRSA